MSVEANVAVLPATCVSVRPEGVVVVNDFTGASIPKTPHDARA